MFWTLFCPSQLCSLYVPHHSAIFCWCKIQYPKSPVPASVTDLVQRVSQYEDTVIDVIKKALENPPPSVSSVSESMEDLEVKQADSGCCGGECKETDCCKGGEKMELDVPKLPKMPCSGSDCSPSSRESLNHLLQRCVDLVSELGLPQELIGHVHELENL